MTAQVVRVKNVTGIRQVVSHANVILEPGMWTEKVPLGVALWLKARGMVEVQLPSDEAQCAWRTADDYYMLWMSPFSCGDGYATAAENMVHILRRYGVHVHARYLWFLITEGLLPETISMLKETTDKIYEVGLCMATPGEFAKLPTPYKIGLTMYESTDPLAKHPEWRHQCNGVDHLFVPTQYCADVFGEFARVPITVVPLAIDPSFVRGAQTPVKHAKDTFTFVSHGVLTGRKCPLETLDLFYRVFPKEKYPDVRIAFKTRDDVFGVQSGILPDITDPRVTIIPDGRWPREQLHKWLDAADCEIFLSRGEGFGMPARESMAMGVPTITTINTGHQEINDARYIWPVPTKEEVDSPLGGTWLEPDWDAAAEAMMDVYRNRDRAYQKAHECAIWFDREHGEKAVAAGFRKALVGIGDPFTHVREKRTRAKNWSQFYPPTDPKTVKFLCDHHKKYLDQVMSLKPTAILEVGVGGGATMTHYIANKIPTIGIDSDPLVLKSCAKTLADVGLTARLEVFDAFLLQRGSFGIPYAGSVCTSQGLLEHFSDGDIRRLVYAMLKVSYYVAFSVPSVFYPSQDLGDERLMRKEQWLDILKNFNVTTSEYYGGDNKQYHLMFVIAGPDGPKRGVIMRYGRTIDNVWRPT